ncbi:hypothetical protein [Arthrobacter sp. NEB 688]|uniref:hypothetical protein n=1 Tax=Arthrobacter sp. NEB 688 TaxID=904039 RepID=UPI00156528F3|nr:hypothetical protein [Arthrobacter sp. NEB 688]QKE84151.1 hypothetical protein HL663_09525 [Arthrobacter sp. NEB 688]
MPIRPTRTALAVVALALLASGASVSPAAAATLPPTAPSGLVATTDPSIAWWIHLTWTDNTPASSPDNETRFEIERCLGATCTDFANIMSYATPGFDVGRFDDTADKPDGTTWSYRVRGVNDAGASAWTPVATGTTAWRAPAAPTTLAAAYVGADRRGLNGSSVVTWSDAATTEAGYVVGRCDAADCAATTVRVPLPADRTSYRDDTVVDGREYLYAVTALGRSGHDSTTGPLSHTAGRGLAAATSLAARRVTAGVRLTWRNQARGPVRIWRCDTALCVDGLTGAYRPDGPWTLRTTVPAGATAWTDVFVPAAATRYSYRVQVVTPSAVSAPVHTSLTTG